MKVIFNYATRQFEPMEPTMRERFALGGSIETPKRGLVDEPGSYGGEPLPKNIQNWLIKTFPDIKFDFKNSTSIYGFSQKGNEAKHKSVQLAAKKKMADPDYVYVQDIDLEKAKYEPGS